MKVVRTASDAREALASHRAGARVGLVPTMGALHAGHEALLQAARDECDLVAASIFVNPAQFAEEADLASYPRDEERDLAVAERTGVDVLFAPTADEMYAAGFQTWVEVSEVGAILEGAFRPGHFRGVATVCLKLFNLFGPDVAYFGQKDAQQVEVIRRMILDLDLDLEVRVVPTVRDPDGLAISSRNAALSPADREQALLLSRALSTRDVDEARAILSGLDVDYVEVADFDPPVIAGAVRIGRIRLIDNVPLEVTP